MKHQLVVIHLLQQSHPRDISDISGSVFKLLEIVSGFGNT